MCRRTLVGCEAGSARAGLGAEAVVGAAECEAAVEAAAELMAAATGPAGAVETGAAGGGTACF